MEENRIWSACILLAQIRDYERTAIKLQKNHFLTREAYDLFPVFSFPNSFIHLLIHWMFDVCYYIHKGYNRIEKCLHCCLETYGEALGTLEINLKFSPASFTADAEN